MVSTGQQAFMKTELRASQIVVFSECEYLVIPEALSAGESVLGRERFAVPAALPVMLHPAQRHPCGGGFRCNHAEPEASSFRKNVRSTHTGG
jgi:hypothetical protein